MEVNPPYTELTRHYTTVPQVPPTSWCPKCHRTAKGSQGPSEQPAPNKWYQLSSQRYL